QRAVAAPSPPGGTSLGPRRCNVDGVFALPFSRFCAAPPGPPEAPPDPPRHIRVRQRVSVVAGVEGRVRAVKKLGGGDVEGHWPRLPAEVKGTLVAGRSGSPPIVIGHRREDALIEVVVPQVRRVE